MKLLCECTYCGHTWIESCYVYNVEIYKQDLTCKNGNCKDRNIKFKEEVNTDVFGYEISTRTSKPNH